MKNKMKKEDKILFLIILAVTAMLGNAFLQTHFSSDTYVLINLGYMEYPSQFFLLDGRLISTLICYIAGIYKIPYTAYLIGMDCIGIFLLSLTIYIFHKKIIDIIGAKEKLHKLLILLATYVMIFNQFTLEYLLFPESAVMCLAVLCTFLAAIQTIGDKKHKYLKIFLYLFIVVISYQSLILAFPVIVLFLQFINMKNAKQKNLKKNIIDLIKYACIVITVIAIEYGIVMLMNKILGEEMIRVVYLINFEAFLIRTRYAVESTVLLFLEFTNMLPTGFLPMILNISIITMFINKSTRKYVIQNIFLIFVASLECIAFMFLFDSGQCARTSWVIAILWGIALLYLLIDLDINKKTGKFIVALVVCSFVFNSFMLLQNSAQHIAANAVDRNDGYTIKAKVDKYEEETGNTVTRFAYIYDYRPSQFAVGIKRLGSLTERALSCSWSIEESVNYYTERKLTHAIFPLSMYFEKMHAIDYEGFSEEQIYIEGDTLYIVVY